MTSSIGPHRLRSDDRFELVPGWPGAECSALASGTNHEVWTASWDEAAKTSRILSFERGVFRPWATPPALANDRVIDLLGDTEGRVWARSLNDLWVLPRGGGAFEHHSTLPSHPLRAGYLALDPKGDLLVPTQEALYRLQNGKWNAWTVEQGLPTSWLYNAIVDREGSLWVGGTGGLYRVLGRSLWGGATRADGLPDNSVWALAMDREQHLWVGTGNGLVRVTEKGFELVPGTQSRTVWAIAFDKTDRVWMGLPLMGLWRWDPRTQRMDKFQVGPSEGAVVQLVIDSDDMMWIATTRLGLYSLDLKSQAPVPTRVELPDGKPDETILVDRAGKGRPALGAGRKRARPARVRCVAPILDARRAARTTRERRLRDQERRPSGRLPGALGSQSVPLPRRQAAIDLPSEPQKRGVERGHLQPVRRLTGLDLAGDRPGGRLADAPGRRAVHAARRTHFRGLHHPDVGSSDGRRLARNQQRPARFSRRALYRPAHALGPVVDGSPNQRSRAGGRPARAHELAQQCLSGLPQQPQFCQSRKDSIRGADELCGRGLASSHELRGKLSDLPPGEYVLEARARVGRGAWSGVKTSTFRIVPTWYQNLWVRAAALVGFAVALSVLVVRVRERAARAEKRRLEELIAARTRELNTANSNMRLVLDNVDQGLALVDLKGELLPEPSAAFASWFGAHSPGAHFASHIAAPSSVDQARLRLGYEQVTDGFLPARVALEQLPKELVVGDNHYALKWKPVIHDATLEGSLLMVSDVTSQVAARRADAIQREQIETFELVMRDRFGYLEFFAEARGLVDSVRQDRFATPEERLRAIHTLKGNAALFRVKTVSDAAHRLEQAHLDEETELIDRSLRELALVWERYSERTLRLLGENPAEQVHFSRMELKDFDRGDLGSGTRRTIDCRTQKDVGGFARRARARSTRANRRTDQGVVDSVRQRDSRGRDRGR